MLHAVQLYQLDRLICEVEVPSYDDAVFVVNANPPFRAHIDGEYRQANSQPVEDMPDWVRLAVL